jgi:putative DNA primase/helicase
MIPSDDKRPSSLDGQPHVFVPNVAEVVLHYSPLDDNRIAAFNMAENLKDIFRFYTPAGDNSDIWVYDANRGIWATCGKELIAEIVTRSMAQFFKTRILNEVINQIRNLTRDRTVELGGCKDNIIVRNGTVNIETGVFSESFDPDEYHITALPVTYDPKATCPGFRKFLDDVFTAKDDILAIEEFLGYMLYKSNTYEIVVLLNGSGSNGKTVLLDVMKLFLGHENITSIPPQRFETSNFAAAQLQGKLANVCADIPSQMLKYTGLLKMITSTDLIYAEHKNKTPFTFENYAKLIFSCNTVPASYDDSDAFYRRWRIIDLPNTFTPDSEGYVPKDELMEQIASETELSGILNLALEGLQRLRENHQLTGTTPLKERKADYIFRSDPAHYFFVRYLCQDSQAPPIEKGVLFDIYVNWCHAKDKTPISDQWFAKKLKRLVPYAAEERPRDGSSRKRSWIVWSTRSTVSSYCYSTNAGKRGNRGKAWTSWTAWTT